MNAYLFFVMSKISYDLGEGVLPTMAYTGRLRPKGCTFFRLQVYKRVGISQAEVYKRVGISQAEVYKRVGISQVEVYKRVGISQAEVYKRVGISQAEVYKRVRKSVISVFKMGFMQNIANRRTLWLYQFIY